MIYERFYPNGWQSGETGGTPITPEALDHMERGIMNSAPAGHGLGAGQHTTDFNTCLSNGWYYGTSATAHAPNGFTTNCSCFVIARTASQIYQYFQYPNNGCVLQRYTTDGGATWNEEWVNPPMVLGVEYRTTERYNGKVVYAQALTETWAKGTDLKFTDFTAVELIRYSLRVGTMNLPYINGDLTNAYTSFANVFRSDYNIEVDMRGGTGNDGKTMYFAAWYTKD